MKTVNCVIYIDMTYLTLGHTQKPRISLCTSFEIVSLGLMKVESNIIIGRRYISTSQCAMSEE